MTRALRASVALAALAMPLAAQQAPVPPGAFAAVDGVAILRTEVEAEVARGGFSPAQALQRLVGAQVLRGRLVAAGSDPATLTDAEVEAGLAEAQEAMRRVGVPPERVAELAKFKDQLRVPIAFDRHVKALLEREDLTAQLPRLRLQVAGEVRARVIVLATDAAGGEKAALERAKALLARLGPSPDDAAFAALAREASDDPMHALTGGDLEWFAPREGRMAPAIVDACCARGEPGLVAEPVVTRRAVLLLYVVETRFPPGATLEALRPRLIDAARAKRANELMKSWLRETPIAYAPDAPRG